MMLTDQIGQTSHFFREEVLSRRGAAHFWEERFLPRWLPLLLGVALAGLVAILIARGPWPLALVVALAVPLAVALIHCPFAAVPAWFLLAPFTLEGGFSIGVQAYWAIYRCLLPLALVLAILKNWFGPRERRPVRLGPAEYAALVFAVLTIASVGFLGPDHYYTFVRSFDLIMVPLLLYMVVRLTPFGERDFRLLAASGLIAIVAQSALGVLSWINPDALPEQWQSLAGARAIGTFPDPASYTATLVFAACLLTHLAARTTSRLTRLASMLGVALAMLGVLLSFSRGSWLGCALVVLGLLVAYRRAIGPLLVVGLIAAMLLGGVFLPDLRGFVEQRLSDEGTVDSRIISSMASIRMIGERPLFGWGFGNLDRYDNQFKVRTLNIPVRDAEAVHNAALSVASQLGLVGLLVYAYPAIHWLSRSARAWRHLPRDATLGRLLLVAIWLGALNNLVVSSFVDTFLHQQFATALWWLSLGLVAAVVERGTSDVRPSNQAGGGASVLACRSGAGERTE